MRRKGSFIPPAPPTPLGAYSHVMNAMAPMASTALGAGGAVAGSLVPGAGPLGAALGGMVGGAAAPAMLAPVNALAQGEKGLAPRAPMESNGPAAMALLMRSMGSKMGKKPEAPPSTRATTGSHGMSAGQLNSYADQVKQEQAALDAGAPPPDYTPAEMAPRTTPIANTPQQPDEAMKPGPRSLAEQRRRQMNGGM